MPGERAAGVMLNSQLKQKQNQQAKVMERTRSYIFGAGGGGGNGGGGRDIHMGLAALKRAASSLTITNHGDDKEEKSTIPKLIREHSRFKMGEATKTLLKVHVIKEKALDMMKGLKELQMLTETIRDRFEDLELQEDFVNKTLDVEGQVATSRKLILLLCKHKALEKHLSSLKLIQEQMRPTLDISVQYFGVDWDHIFRIAGHFVKLAEDLAVEFNDLTDENNEMDIIIPNNILRNLSIIEADVFSNAEAVLKGRLSQRHKDKILKDQKRYSIYQNTTLQLQRIENNLFEDKNRSKSLWANLKKEVQNGVLSRKTKKSSQEDHDDLWRTWYTHVMLAPVAVTTTNLFEDDEDKDDGVKEEKKNTTLSEKNFSSSNPKEENVPKKPNARIGELDAIETLEEVQCEVSKDDDLAYNEN